MTNILQLNEFYNFLFSSIICLLNFLLFLKAHKLYSKNNEHRMAIIAVGFLIGSLFEFFHAGYAFINAFIQFNKLQTNIIFIYLSLSNIGLASSIFISLIHTPEIIKVNVNIKKLYCFSILSVILTAFFIHLFSNIAPEIFYNFSQKIIVNNPSIEILDNVLYILSAFLLIDMRKLNNQKICTCFLIGILILGIGQLYVVTSSYLESFYRFYIHISKIIGIVLIYVGLTDLFTDIKISSFRYKLITYPSLIIMGLYIALASISLVSFNTIFSEISKYIFLVFFVISIIIQYFLSLKLTSQISNAISYVKELQTDKISDLTQAMSNEEVEALIQKFDTPVKLDWKTNQELSFKQYLLELYSREELLKKISGAIRNPTDVDKIKKNIVTEVGKTFNADRCFIRLYGPNDTILSIEAEYLASQDEKSSRSFRFSKEFNEYVKSYYNNKQSLIIYDNKDIFTDPDINPAYKEFIRYLDVKSSYGFPIFINDKVIGAFVIQYTKKITRIDDNSIELLKMISDHAAVALYQAKLFGDIIQRNEDEKLLKEIISISKSNLEIKELLSIICEKIADTLGVQRVSIIYLQGINNEEVILSEYKEKGIKGPKEVDKFNNEVRLFWLNKLIIKGQTIIINNLSEYNMPEKVREIYEIINVKSIIGIPLKIGDNKWSVLFVYGYYTPKYWTDNEINTLQVIKEHISIAIREKNIYSQEKFLTNISHELKTPIAIINSYTEALINRDKNKSEMGEKFLKIIKNNIDRLNCIIDDLLYLSTIENSLVNRKQEFSRVEIIDVIKSSVELCENKANSKNIIININYDKPIYANINSLLIQQALINLINNAINYSNVNTSIFISSVENDNEILINVQDQGCGIEEEHFENIFKRFYRIDKSRSRETGGSGLGLSIVQKIVESHNGYVSIDSIPGKGSTFTIHLSS